MHALFEKKCCCCCYHNKCQVHNGVLLKRVLQQGPFLMSYLISNLRSGTMYQFPVRGLEKIRRTRKKVKNILGEFGLEECLSLCEVSTACYHVTFTSCFKWYCGCKDMSRSHFPIFLDFQSSSRASWLFLQVPVCECPVGFRKGLFNCKMLIGVCEV